MTKIKISVEIDIDFQKFIDEIPEGTFSEKSGIDDDWKLTAVGDVLSTSYSDQLMHHMNWMAKSDPEHYIAAKHQLKIAEEIAKQIRDNAKLEINE